MGYKSGDGLQVGKKFIPGLKKIIWVIGLIEIYV